MVAINGDTADIPSVNFGVQGSDISAPGSGRAQLYVKSNGVWYILNGGTATRLMDNPLTTAGDLLLSGASGAPTRLAKGNDSDVLTIDPATHLPVWATPSSGLGTHYAVVHHSTTTSIPNGGVSTPLAFDTEVSDTDAYHDTVTNNERLTIPSGQAGTYAVGFVAQLASGNGTGSYRIIDLVLNNTTPLAHSQGPNTAASYGVSHCWIGRLAEADYVTVKMAHDANAAILTNRAASWVPVFWLVRLF